MSAKIKEKKAVALIITFIAISVLLAFVAVFISVSINQNINTTIFNRSTKVSSLAYAGLDHAVNWLRAQPASPVGDRVNPWGSVQNLGGGSYSVTITDLGLVGGSGGETRRYKVDSTGSFENINQVLTNYVQVDNYARYLWFSDVETYGGTTVWFWTLDRLNGPTQTNGNFNIFGNPIFEGVASSAANYIRFYNNGSSVNLSQPTNSPNDVPDFQKGMVFGVTPTVMPVRAASLRSAALSVGGLLLTGNTTVVLNSDGTMNVTNTAKSWSNRNMPLPANGALFVDCGSRCRTGASLTLSGTLNGKLTVGAARDILVPNNIVYADDPRVNPDSDDVLGVIAERDVVIRDSAPTDLEIDGCVMALGTSFMRENWWSGLKGTLTVDGGIIQDQRGPVGTFNGTTKAKLSGYSKNYLYDSRLLSNPPPFIPTTGDYITLAWEDN